MKLNISYPANGSQKLVEIEDERKLRDFMEKRVCNAEIPICEKSQPASQIARPLARANAERCVTMNLDE